MVLASQGPQCHGCRIPASRLPNSAGVAEAPRKASPVKCCAGATQRRSAATLRRACSRRVLPRAPLAPVTRARKGTCGSPPGKVHDAPGSAAGRRAGRTGAAGVPPGRTEPGERGAGGTPWGTDAPAPAAGGAGENPPLPGGRLPPSRVVASPHQLSNVGLKLASLTAATVGAAIPSCPCRRLEAPDAAAPQSTHPGRRRFPYVIASGRSRGGRPPQSGPAGSATDARARPSGSARHGGQP